MVKFVAYDQVELNHLLTMGHFADTGSAVVSQRSSTGFKVHQGDKFIKADFYFKGHDIKYVGGYPWQGTLTSLLVKINGEDAYAASNVSMSVQTAWDLYRMTDPMKFAARLLSGNDTIIGSPFDDTLYGFKGNDVISGRLGDDLIVGGLGRDTQTGGGGADRFDFNAKAESAVGLNRDVLADFSQAALDRIDLASIDADASLGGNQAFAFIGTDPFAAHASDGMGLVRIKAGAGFFVVQVDIRGTAAAVDMEIKVVTASALVGGDFFL